MSLRIAAVTILYNPDQTIVTNINSYLDTVEHLFLIDNSITKTSFSGLHHPEKITFIHNGENRGIAARLNEAAEYTQQMNIEWLLTMDQDSFFEARTIEKYIDCVSKFEGREKVSIFSANPFQKKQAQLTNCDCSEKLVAITSGSIVNLRNFNKIGPFDEQLFIDEVDHEYCLRSITQGYKVVLFTNIPMNHFLGETSFHKSLKSLKTTPRKLHSPVRIYYMTRNHFYVKRIYKKQFKAFFNSRDKDLFITIKNNIMYRGNRLAVIKNIVMGYVDFKRNRMGKIM